MPFNDIPTKILFILKKSVKGKYINWLKTEWQDKIKQMSL